MTIMNFEDVKPKLEIILIDAIGEVDGYVPQYAVDDGLNSLMVIIEELCQKAYELGVSDGRIS